MSILAWIKSRFATHTSEVDEKLVIDDAGVTYHRRSGMVESIAWDDLQKVSIKTTDGGPFAVDAHYILYGSAGGCIVPQSAPQSGALLERLQELPHFDNNAVISAMGCTDNKEFLCWVRPTS